MDAISLINQNLDVDLLLNHFDFDGVKPDGQYLRARCKLHGGDNPSSFVISRETGLYYCHTGCGGGDVFTLVQKLEGIEFKQAVRRVAELLGVDIDNLQIVERKADYMKDIKAFLDTMRARNKKQKIAYQIDAETRNVSRFRDFKQETLNHFGLTYAEVIHLKKRDGEPYTLRNRLLFPIVFNDTMVGVSIRRIKSSDNPKWLHQPVNIDTKELLYNYDAIKGATEIVICEGIVDVWAYHEIGVTAVCTFGAHLTDEQYRLLIRTGADLIWSYDGDEAGRIATQRAVLGYREKDGKFVNGKFHLKANNYLIEFADSEDPASISREELAKRYDSKRRI